MTLTYCSDRSAAGWITTEAAEHLIDLGPPGFTAYARLRFVPDPTYAGQRENDVEFDLDAPSESAQIHAALRVLAGHTRTPDDCYFCLWDGWGWEVRGGEAPKVVLPIRAYFLFRGALSDFGDSGADWGTDPSDRAVPPDPAFIWPADHAWCVANDVDPHYAGIAANAAAIEDLLAEPLLDVVATDPDAAQPHYW